MNTFDGGRVLVRGELLVTEYRESFLECELKPVSDGDTITCPVVEVFMTNDTLDPKIVRVRRSSGVRKNIFGVEDV